MMASRENRVRTLTHAHEHTRIQGSSKVHALSRPVYTHAQVSYSGCTWVHDIAHAPTPERYTPNRRGFLPRKLLFPPNKPSPNFDASISLRVSRRDRGGRSIFFHSRISYFSCVVQACLRKLLLTKLVEKNDRFQLGSFLSSNSRDWIINRCKQRKQFFFSPLEIFQRFNINER